MRKGEYTGENLIFEIVWKVNCKLSADLGIWSIEGKEKRFLSILGKGHKRHQLVYQHQNADGAPKMPVK